MPASKEPHDFVTESECRDRHDQADARVDRRINLWLGGVAVVVTILLAVGVALGCYAAREAKRNTGLITDNTAEIKVIERAHTDRKEFVEKSLEELKSEQRRMSDKQDDMLSILLRLDKKNGGE